MEDISRGAAGADFGGKGFHDLRKIGAVFCSTNIFWGRLLMMVILKQFLVGSSFHTKPV